MYRLIIADDEEMVREGIRKTIPWEHMGVTVTACVGDGRALYQQAISTCVDIALVDIRMPVMDGLEAIERLKAELPGCEFIIFTAYEDFSYAKKALELGVMAYITKPVLPSEVIEKVQLAVKRLEKRRGGLVRNADAADAAPISRIKRYIRSHLDSKLSLTEVAEYMQMNPTYLSRYFKEKTGVNFADYCKQAKMERARELLLHTNLKIYEIASQLGYQSTQHFSTAFKEWEGSTPLECRQRTQKENA